MNDGDVDAFLALVERHRRYMYNLALRLTGNEQDAKDVVQESVLDAFLHLDRFEGTIGALNLFRTEPGPLSEADLGIGQAMADVATVGLLQERAIAARELLATQLQTALISRVQLEQAKGMLAQRSGLSMDQAFQLMRAYARSNNRRLSDIATQIIDGSLDKDMLAKDRRTKPGTRPKM